jgi:hypothetical protein
MAIYCHCSSGGCRARSCCAQYSPQRNRAIFGVTASPKPGRRRGGRLETTTERLARATAAMRRAAADEVPAQEVAVALRHVEESLDDLAEAIACMAHVAGQEDASSGGLSWRLRTLQHALHPAQVCAGARAVVPHPALSNAEPNADADERARA